MPPDTNHPAAVAGRVLRLGARRRSCATCRDEVLAAIRRLEHRTGERVFTVARVFAEMRADGTSYTRGAVAKTMQRMKGSHGVHAEGVLIRVGRLGFRLRCGG